MYYNVYTSLMGDPNLYFTTLIIIVVALLPDLLIQVPHHAGPLYNHLGHYRTHYWHSDVSTGVELVQNPNEAKSQQDDALHRPSHMKICPS